jgi:uncharacterized protein (DUF488 family)
LAEQRIFTIGHGDRTLSELTECLSAFEVRTVADVRSWPRSRHLPHFDRDALEPALTSAGFLYRFLGRELGGFRSTGYEAHMETNLFKEGIKKLKALAKESPTAFLCSERDPAGCHRRHIAEVLKQQGFTVEHIVRPGQILLPGERPDDQGTLVPL